MMEVILLEKIHNLGELGEVVRVRNGYARNFLLPQKKAMVASEEAKLRVEERRAELAAEEGKRLEAAKARADLCPKEVKVMALAMEDGKLYGSVSPADVAEALVQSGGKVEKAEVVMEVIKELGEFVVGVVLHAEVRFEVRVEVVGGEGS